MSAIRAWIRTRAGNHKSFRVWGSLAPHYYPAYMTFRMGLRTGNSLPAAGGPALHVSNILCTR